ncbi:glycine zipper 2TM domain-containing protein [Paraburkholderia sp. UCT31]|uniref:glycine zipper 2TM domain-containing protein n=1 Tax=Paraburkholderia sp. UCT31 TaxID=2615209 RepID=UPI00165519F9|nr:glycine zipper 2TM domain-containing protein [Paraburkholderia sp. UCT31]MBC8737348.1 glycine zipper 2TM domain-containing protein [Paraburkholderia sp. UCT31]
MKIRNLSPLALLLAACAANAATFTDSARVVDVQPVRERITSQQCDGGRAYDRHETSNGNIAGTLLGGVVGGVLGNQVGGGRGRTAATIVGAIGGTVVGNSLTRPGESSAPECHEVEQYNVTGYDVTYEYRAVRETVNMSYDPGVGSIMQVRVSVSPLR